MDRGLRDEAFATLKLFIASVERADFQVRREFVSWLLAFAHHRDGSEVLIPYPLKTRIVEPTLSEWTLIETQCGEPHRWIGDREHLEIALNLDPSDQIARKKLIIDLLRYIEYAGHELPAGYIGDARKDLLILNRAEQLLRDADDAELRKHLISDIQEERAAIEDYIRSRK